MTGFGWLDVAVMVAYAVCVLGIGLWFGRGERSTDDYFLGGRRQHWLVVGLSIVATEVSALTFIGVPADAFRGDWTYLQMYMGSFVGRMLIVLLLLPAFYASPVTTIYEYLGHRFGQRTRTAAASMFILSRLFGSGIRLLVASIAIAVVFDWPLPVVVVGSALVAVVYTTLGGIKAIIWTDALQAFIFVAAGVAAAILLFSETPGSWSENLSQAAQADKLRVFVWDWHPNNEKGFGLLMIHAMVLTMASMGADQDLTQRMLTCSSLRRGQRSLIFNAIVGAPIVCLFLLIGTLLFLFFDGQEGGAGQFTVEQTDRIFPFFIATAVPIGVGLKGLLVAGVFAAAMSSVDSALGALSSTVVTDFYQPLLARRGRGQAVDDAHLLRIARVVTIVFGVILAVIALAFSSHPQLLWAAFKWASLFFGGLLGVFLLGVTTRRRGSDRLNVIAMLTSVLLLAGFKLYETVSDEVFIVWPWWVVIGTGWTYLIGACGRGRSDASTDL